MRHGTSGRRSRNRGNGGNPRRGGGGGGGQPRTQVFDSNGPEVRIRGTAFQIQEKYVTLAKDAAASGNRVLAESYLQHAEHYQRLINSWQLSHPPVSSDIAETEDESEGEEMDARFESRRPAPVAAREDDLGLPASILGPKPNVVSEHHNRTEADTFADA